MSQAIEDANEPLIKNFLKTVYGDELPSENMVNLLEKIAIDVTSAEFRKKHNIGHEEALTIYSEVRDHFDYIGETTEKLIDAYNF